VVVARRHSLAVAYDAILAAKAAILSVAFLEAQRTVLFPVARPCAIDAVERDLVAHKASVLWPGNLFTNLQNFTALA
jgi:hypothetical protein